MSKRYSQNLEP